MRTPRRAERPTQSKQPAEKGRHETPFERADRRWAETLQEVRVAQTGAQILFGFLLSVAFTPRFTQLNRLENGLYIATVVLGALATGTLIAPVAFHRILAGHRLKLELVQAAHRLVALGVILLALAIATALLLLLLVATGGGAVAWVISAVVMGWFAICWLVMPAHLLRRRRR
ncbi:DUF6328 family protein [Kitasatospora sp. RB6PN24]|uniref:DUF6328 family protein n=1 Tax=Kitasatospora humi TaxID=2893891 RepID=UPI001E3FD3BF|nr:DUF6328 family protein [Kitasatospora humi]MCC9307908.1 DUF6328 family protein [Kitasatospora humi]